MATTYRNTGSKYWFARFTDRHGKRISRSTKTESRREAKRLAAEMEATERKALKQDADIPRVIFRTMEIAALELQQGQLTASRAEELIRSMVRAANPDAKEGSFKRFAAAWLDEKEKTIKPDTSKSYRDAVKHCSTAIGTKIEQPLHKFITADISTMQTHMTAKGLRSKTISQHLSVISRIFEAALHGDLVAKNPAKAIKYRRKADSRPRAPFTLPEVRLLLDKAPDKEWKGLVTLAAHTGLRCGDIRRLHSDNLEGTTIRMLASKTRETTQTILTIPLSPPCIAWVEGRTGDLFPRLKTLKNTTVCAQFNKIMKSAGIAKTVVLVGGENSVTATKSFHSLRHSFCSWLANADIHADVRQKLAGHASDAVHALYTHHDEALDRAVASLPAL